MVVVHYALVYFPLFPILQNNTVSSKNIHQFDKSSPSRVTKKYNGDYYTWEDQSLSYSFNTSHYYA
jgi:hypothetical protein